MSASFVLERLSSSARSSAAEHARIKRQRIYILPTREGLLFSVLLLTMLLGAMNYNNSMAYLLTFLLGGLFLVCMLHTHRNLAGLIISGARPEPVFAGDTAQFPVCVDNLHGPVRTALHLACQPRRKGWRNFFGPAGEATHVDIPGQRMHRVNLHVAAQYRGLLPLDQVVISGSFPLGLFYAWSVVPLDQHCVVYPRPAGNTPLPAPASGTLQGEQGRHEGSNDFTGFRQYHPGDSIRNIAWKTLARAESLLVKRFSGDGSHSLMLSWDDTAHLQNSEARLSQLCRWILLAEKQGWNYALTLPDTHIESSRGLPHRNQCLETLARYGHGHGT